MASTFAAYSGAMPTTGNLATVASSAVSGTVKTILQVQANATSKMRVIEWGYGFDAAPANNPKVELIETGTVAATVTAHVSSGIIPWNDSGASSGVQLGTSGTGYNATAEGSVTATRLLDYCYENGLYMKRQWPLGREPEVAAGRILRVRVTPTSNVSLNVWTYIVWEE